MATDRLINQTQGDAIIAALQTMAAAQGLAISVTPARQDGDAVATITINGTSVDLYSDPHAAEIAGKQAVLPVTGAANRGVYVSAAGVVSQMSHTLDKDVPANAVFTDTTYSPAVPGGANGLMTGADKAKLDDMNIPAGGISMPETVANQSMASFTSASAGRPLRVTAHIEAVQASGTPSPSTPLPITGWTGVNIFIGNKNCAWLNTTSMITITRSTNSITNIITDTRTTLGLRAWYYNQSGLIGFDQLPPTGGMVISIPSGTTKMTFGHSGSVRNIITEIPVRFSGPHYLSYTTSGTDPSVLGGMTINNIQLETGSIATDFVAPNEPITVSFPSSIGTVYGGTLDVTRGLLTVTHASANLGALTWEIIANTGYFATASLHNKVKLPASNNVLADAICEAYPVVTLSNAFSNTVPLGIAVQTSPSVGYVAIRDRNKAGLSAADFATSLSGIHFVYQLATPVTYQLTPQQLTTLANTNNVFADCGPVTVTHWPGTGTPVEPVDDMAEIAWKAEVLRRLDALEAVRQI